MPDRTKFLRCWLAMLSACLCACASPGQRADEVLILDPATREYSDPQEVASSAVRQWEFAVMSENAYHEGRVEVGALAPRIRASRLPDSKVRLTENGLRGACANDDAALPLIGWRRWDFPSPGLKKRMLAEGMYMEIQERNYPPYAIAVVFEGTNFTDLSDWKANFNWLLRIIPAHTDQYALTAGELVNEFQAELAHHRTDLQFDPALGLLKRRDGQGVRLITTGHSLGAGLAQYFAYAYKRPANGAPGPSVSEVFAFNPTPVTGWFSAFDAGRTANVKGLEIERIYEHGEVLSYLRLLTSRFGSSVKDPAIWDYRYNFDRGWNLFGKHSIRRLACGLAIAARPWEKKSATAQPKE